jgi:hypothetical protein
MPGSHCRQGGHFHGGNPDRGIHDGLVVAVTMVVMEIVVATAACRARLSNVLSSCNGGSRSRPIIGDEDGRFGL